MKDAEVYIKRYQNNYELWMKEIMDAKITDDQRVLSKALAVKNFVSAKSGTTTGKTTCLATKGLWFLTTHPEAKVVCTAPTGHQLEDLLFAEMEAWIRRIKFDRMREAINVIKGKIYIEGFRDWYIAARTIPRDSRDKLGDVLAGFHAPNLLFVVDEASGVPDAVFKGIEGSMIQKNVSCLLAGNPTRNQGYFYDTHNKNKSSWANVTLSSLRSPFVDQTWVARMKELHGEDSDFYRTKILGEFPKGGSTSLITFEQVLAAIERWHSYDTSKITGRKVAGLDPAAGSNDYSILTFRQDDYIFEPIRIKHVDTNDLVTKVNRNVRDAGAKELYVDYIGVGVGVFDQLKRKYGYKTFKVVSNARANDPDAYRNLRAELYTQLSDNFDLLALPDHDRYVQELPEIITIEDKVPAQIVDKPYLRNRLGFSTDYSDSLMLTTYRHFNIGSCMDAEQDISAYININSNLVKESAFEKI